MARPPDLHTIARPWVAAYPPGVPPTYRIPAVPLPRLLDDAIRDFPTEPALRCGEVVMSHVELRDRVAVVATVLRDLGIGSGDRVLVATGTTATTPIALLALWRIGAVAVPLPPGRDRQRRAVRAVEIATATGVGAVLATSDHLDDLAAAGLVVPTVLATDDEGWLRPAGRWRVRVPRPRRRRGGGGVPTTLVAAVAATTDAPVTRHGAGPVEVDRPAMLVPRWRGGERRAIVLTQANLVASTFQARLWVPDIQAGRERVVVAGDLLSPGPMVLGWLAGLLAAAEVELVAPDRTPELARIIARGRATLAILEPAQVAELVQGNEGNRRDLSSLRVVLAAGGPLDPELAAELERRTGGARVREGFGVSEAGPITHAQPVYGRTTPGAMGLPVTDTVAAVVDVDDLSRLTELGEPGRLLLAGPQVSPGYFEDPEATAARFVDGWLVTDDLASVDADGVFTHLGRRDEVLVTDGGHLVSPRRLEHVLEQHPGVRRAGVTTDASGAVVAAVTVQRRHRPTPEELVTHGRAHLDSRDAPTRVILVEELPENDAGGVAREDLRALLDEG